MLADTFDGVDDAARDVTQREFILGLALALLAPALRGRLRQIHTTIADLPGQSKQQTDANHLLQFGNGDRRILACFVIGDHISTGPLLRGAVEHLPEVCRYQDVRVADRVFKLYVERVFNLAGWERRRMDPAKYQYVPFARLLAELVDRMRSKDPQAQNRRMPTFYAIQILDGRYQQLFKEYFQIPVVTTEE